MQKFALLKIYLLCILFINSSKAFSQNLTADTTAEAVSFNTAVNLYHVALSPETGLYNGSEYAYNFYYPFTINQGDPFFQSAGFDTGAVFYNKVLYEKVALLYDLVKDEVLTHDPTNNYIIRLNSDKVVWFNMYGHTFVRLFEDNVNNPRLHTGFYDQLYNGNTPLYKKDSKILKENSASFQGINKYVVEINEYFIKKDNQYYPVRSKKSVLAVLNNKKKEITQFMKKNKLNLRKAGEVSLMKIVAYYDEINTNNTKAVN